MFVLINLHPTLCSAGLCPVRLSQAVVLKNPYDPVVELATFFLKIPFMGTIFTDTHFCTRDRMGRLLTFLSRELQEQFALPGALRGVGVDEETALLLGEYRSTGTWESVPSRDIFPI